MTRAKERALSKGEERSCRELHNLAAAKHYQETNRFRSKHHRRA